MKGDRAMPIDKKEKVKNVNVDENKKIDLYINDNYGDEQGVSIINVFSRLKQRLHIYIYVILLGLIAGLFIPTMIYTFKDKQDTGISILGFDYDGAEEGLAPDGKDLDISYFKSSYIVQNALSNVRLTKEVSAAQVQNNLTITGVLTDETKQQLEILNKLSNDKSSEYAKLIQQFKLKYRAQYIITIGSVFKEGNNKVKLPKSDLTDLLNALTSAYSTYFVETYQDKSLPNNYLRAIDVDTLDYLDILDEISESLEYLENYCDAKASLYSNFRSTDGVSFKDLSSTIETIRNVDIEFIYSYIYLNNVSKNPSIQLTNYKYQKREANLKLTEVNENINTIQNSIDNYKPDTIVISSPDGSTVTTVDRTSDYYNGLVMSLIDAHKEKSSLEKRISTLDYRIDKLEGAPATDEQNLKAKTYVDDAFSNAQRIFELVNDSSNELFDSNNYNNRYMHSVTTVEAEKFTKNLKLFGIGAGAGFLVGLVIWIADAFILEFKSVRKANELKEETNNEK